jgi:glycosyltransferase involved in cell wall biosynthesis
MPRALFVSYTFPPVGGAGVQRLTKWLKYLPAYGWDASVLTTANASVPLTDGMLGREVPAGTRVVRARTLEPSYRSKAAVLAPDAAVVAPDGRSGGRPLRAGLRKVARTAANLALQPDPQVLWAPLALRAGRRLLATVPHDVVVATAPPFSALLIASRLAREARLPLVLDYRDEWDISNRYWENRPRDPLSRWVQARMQASVLRCAQLVIATTRRSAAVLELKLRAAGGRARVRCVYNGYDAEDFAEPAPADAPRDTYRLAYVGTLWALTDVAPLVEGVARLARENAGHAERLEVVLVGRRTPEQSAHVAQLASLPCRVRCLDYVDHGDAVRLMQEASGLCLLLSGGPAAERVVPAKLFEYMAARRPILAIVPPGECRDLLQGHPAVAFGDPRRPESIAAALSAEIERHGQGREPAWAGWDPARYSRRHLAGELAKALDEVAGVRREGAA